MKTPPYLLGLPLAVVLAGGTGLGAAFVRNPSFESNLNNTSDPLAPGQPQGWPYYSSVDEWVGASGVNDVTYDPNGPFHNAGTPVPDRARVGFKQGGGDVTQDITGLVPGETYWLQFFYDGRRGGGASESLIVKFNDQEIGRDPNIRPSTGRYYFMNAPFTAPADMGTIRFTHIVSGDRTLLLDGVTVVARSTNDIVLRNPSFEASGVLPAAGAVANIAGWTQAGTVGVDDGTAGQANNGTIPDQDLVAFLEGESSISQRLDGLIVGNEYEIRAAVNARTGTAPRLQIRIGDTVVHEANVASGSYQNVSVKFTATVAEGDLVIAQTKAGGDVLLVDNVRLLGVVKKPLPPMVFSPLQSEVSPGDTVRYALSIPGEAVESGGVAIRLASSNPNVARLAGAAEDGSLTLQFGPGAGAAEPVAGAKLWLKGDAITGVADGAKVASWPDSSGLNRPAANAVAANQPVYVADGRAGKPVVRFDDGGNDAVPNGVQWLDTPANIQTKNGASYSAFVVFRSDETEVTATALEGRDNLLQPLDVGTGNVGRTVLFIETPGGDRKISSVSAQASINSASSYQPGRWLQAAVVQDAATGTLTLLLDGAPQGTVSMGPEGGQNAGWRIGATKQGHGGLKGDIAELLVYDRALTSAERQQVERYLAGRWNLPTPTTAEFALEALTRGTATINVVDAARIPFTTTPSVNVVGSLVKNASFESNGAGPFPGYGDILGWTRSGGSGLNRADGPTNPAGPFGDNGLVPDREQVAFLQGNGSLSQQINGLTPGRNYWLQFRYNARNCCGERSQTLTVRFAGKELAAYPELKPIADAGEVDYYFASLRFVAEGTGGLLEFVHQVASGDASAVIDAVTIVARATDEIVIQNPSFEASGSPPGVGYVNPFQMTGWQASGGHGVNVDGEGPFSDNGDVPDQDRTAFIQGVGSSLSQNVPGLTAGQKYTLVASLNARNCCGGSRPVVKVSVGDTVLSEEELGAVGGRNPFQARYHSFTADGTEALVRFEISGPAGADVSLLVDDVHLVPGERTPPAITSQPAGVDVDAGATFSLQVAASGSNLGYQWHRNGVPLLNGGRVSGATSATLSVSGAQVGDAGNYTVQVSDGLGVIGSEAAAVNVNPVADAPSLRAVLVPAGVQLRWPATAAGFRLQRSATLGGAWSDENAPIVVDGADNTVTVPAEGIALFRLTN